MLRATAIAGLIVLSMLAIVWLAPGMPYWPQDSAWPTALDQAAADRLAFGRDVLFTFGPWSAVYTGEYHPATDPFMVTGGLIVALGIATGLAVEARGWRLVATPLVPLVVATVGLHDPVFMVLPLLLLVVAVGLAQTAERPAAIPRTRWSVAALLMLASGDALLTFVKLTSGTEALSMAGLSLIALALGRRIRLAILVLVVYAASLVGYWLLIGQRLGDLSAYLESMPVVIDGYTEGQALDGPWTDIPAYLFGAALLAWVIWRDRARCRADGAILLLLGVLLTLFIALKAGFVRHDEHALIALGTLVMLPAVLANAMRVRTLALALLVTCCALTYVSRHYPGYGWPSYAHGRDRLRSAATGAWTRIVHPNRLSRRYAAGMTAIGALMPLPRVTGPTDIYSSGQVILLANGLDWSPRPVLQSVTAFSFALAKADLDHLEGLGDTHSPVQNVFFKVENDDNRLPSMADGLSWPALLSEFRVESYDGLLDTALLRRKPGAQAARVSGPALARGRHRLGTEVSVPVFPTGLAWATLDIRPTLLGRLVSGLFRPPILSITIRYANGAVEHRRLLSQLARSGFLLTSPVSNTQEFLLSLLPERRVSGYRPISIVVAGESGTRWLWRNHYDLLLRSLSIPVQLQVRGMVGPKPGPVTISEDEAVKPAQLCGIDTVNNRDLAHKPLDVSGYMEVSGWSIVSVAARQAPDRMFIRLTDAAGHVWEAQAQTRQRLDISGYFVDPKLAASGFDTMLDLAALRGPLTLTMEAEQGRRRWSCSTTQRLIVNPLSNGAISRQAGRAQPASMAAAFSGALIRQASPETHQ